MKLLLPLFITSLIFLTGCSQKTTIKAIKAAKVSDVAVKNIGVVPFKRDSVSQSSQINSAIANVVIDGKKYFNLSDRNHLNLVMREQKLNEIGVVDLISDSDDAGLKQIETLVFGSVDASTLSPSFFYEERTDFNTCVKFDSKKKECRGFKRYEVECQKNRYTVQSTIKLVKVSNGETYFAKTYKQSSTKKHCQDDYVILPSKKEQNTVLAGAIANLFILDIAPSYVYFSATLLDDPDITYDSKQKGYLKASLDLIEAKRVEKAKEYLDLLAESTNYQSYVALYNLGVVEESLGKVKKALTLFNQAEKIAIEREGKILGEIATAIRRAQRNLRELEAAKKQLQ